MGYSHTLARMKVPTVVAFFVLHNVIAKYPPIEPDLNVLLHLYGGAKPPVPDDNGGAGPAGYNAGGEGAGDAPPAAAAPAGKGAMSDYGDGDYAAGDYGRDYAAGDYSNSFKPPMKNRGIRRAFARQQQPESGMDYSNSYGPHKNRRNRMLWKRF